MVENDILIGRIFFEDVVLFVFDEVYWVVGNYFYVFIVKEYLKIVKYLFVLGFIVFFGSDEEKIREIVRNFGIERIEIWIESLLDVKFYV